MDLHCHLMHKFQRLFPSIEISCLHRVTDSFFTVKVLISGHNVQCEQDMQYMTTIKVVIYCCNAVGLGSEGGKKLLELRTNAGSRRRRQDTRPKGANFRKYPPFNQRKTKGQQQKGKIVSALFHTFSHFSTLFHTFSPRTSLKIKAF